MGYDVSAHLLTSAPDLARLESLPGGIAWTVYRDGDGAAWYVDTYASGKKHEWPFTSVPNLKRIPFELPESLGPLSGVFAALDAAELTHGFELAFVRLNLLLSSTLRLPVLSIYSDDEGVDLACLSEDGMLSRLRGKFWDIDLTFREGTIEIQPLRIDDEDVELTDLGDLHDPARGISVMERNVPHVSRLHGVACAEVSSFLGMPEAPLGLGYFDVVKVPSITVAASVQSTARASSGPDAAPWWKFWGRT
jgi:hypothetical protein